MSVGQVAVSYTGRGASRRPEDRHPLLQAAHRFTPREGWDSFALLAVTMGVVAFTVREAGWVEGADRATSATSAMRRWVPT